MLGPGDAKPVTTTSLVVEGASVAGHAVTIGADGVHAGEQAVAAPVGQGAGSDNQFLGQLGLSARIVPTGVPGGADALVITSRQTFPAPGNPKGTLIMTFGGAASEITVGSADGPTLATPTADGGAAPPTPGAGPPTEAAAAGVASGAPLPVAPPVVGSEVLSPALATGLSLAAPAAVPDGSGSTVATETESTGRLAAFAPTPAPVRGTTLFRVQPDLGTTGALYSLLGLGGIALVAATRLLRWRGGRT
jgi:hypothetical protein